MLRKGVVMHKMVAMVVALMLALAACSSDVSVTANDETDGSGSTDSSGTTDSSAGSDDGSDDSSDGSDDSSDDGSDDDGGFSGEGSDDWCALSEDFANSFDEAFLFEGEAIAEAYEQVLARRDEALATAPPELREHVAVIFDWVENDFLPALEAADYDLEAMDESLLDTPELEAAGDALDAYDEEVCGFGVDDSMDGDMLDGEMFDDDGMLDGIEINDGEV
ncbi:MAG: hypothetical protein KDB21_10080, partial [Acidimicrobiales bacterium]|nr:hypothetical protein [Acidimicrobiales bacterium]